MNDVEKKNVEEEIAELEAYNRDPSIGETQAHINNQRLLCLYAGYRLEPVPMQPKLICAVKLENKQVIQIFSYLFLLYANVDIVRLLQDCEQELLSSSLDVKKESEVPS